MPFGIYNKRLAAGWINKLATDPPVADIPNDADYGVEVEGGLPLGNMKWSYDVSLTNGNQLLTDGEMQGVGSIKIKIPSKAVTARLSLLPFSNSSLEIGVSGQIGKVGDAAAPNQSAQSKAYALDLDYVKLFNPVLVNIKGQYNYVYVTNQNYKTRMTLLFIHLIIRRQRVFAQISLRPTGSSNPFCKEPGVGIPV